MVSRHSLSQDRNASQGKMMSVTRPRESRWDDTSDGNVERGFAATLPVERRWRYGMICARLCIIRTAHGVQSVCEFTAFVHVIVEWGFGTVPWPVSLRR